jgi:hypothetical protein
MNENTLRDANGKKMSEGRSHGGSLRYLIDLGVQKQGLGYL